MKKNYWTNLGNDNMTLEASLLSGAGLFSVIGVFHVSSISGALLLAVAGAACLSMGSHLWYRAMTAPCVDRRDNSTLSASWETVKDTRRIGRNPLLRGDPNAKAAVKAIVRDHQELVHRASWNYKLHGSRPNELRDLQEIIDSMNDVHSALKEALNEREDLAGVNSTRPGSREVARRLREDTQLTAAAKRSLRE